MCNNWTVTAKICFIIVIGNIYMLILCIVHTREVKCRLNIHILKSDILLDGTCLEFHCDFVGRGYRVVCHSYYRRIGL